MEFLTPQNADDIDLIHQILTEDDFKAIKKITRLPSGSRSVAYSADEYIVRFPTVNIIWQTMQREKAVIDMVYPHLIPYFASKIHKIELIDGKYPFSVSQKFYGKICDGRPENEHAVLYQNLSPIQQEKLAQDLAMFFHLMHQIDYSQLNIPEPTEAVDNWDVTTRPDFNYTDTCNALLVQGIDLDSYKIEQMNTVSALCHNDLSGSNMLLNPKKEDVLSGIIDFGNVVIMPKYLDFFPLYKINRKLAVDTLIAYNQLTTSPIVQKQIDFMALAYIGYGLAKSKDITSPYFMRLLRQFLY